MEAEMNTQGYAISGGSEGKSRLNLLASVMQPYTEALLQNLGLGSGANFLDNGCGGGNVAMMAAQIVGETGSVTAIDFDPEIISLAENDRKQAGIEHLSFQVKNAYELDFESQFDFAYARFLLSHLKNPLQALQRMRKAVKPGGKIVVEDVHFSGHFCYPANSSFDQYLNLYSQVVARRGGNADLGPQIPELFRQAGIEDVGFDVIQPCFDKGEGKWMGYITLMRIREAVLEARLLDVKQWETLIGQFEKFTSRNDSIISLPRIFRVWGTRSDF